MKKIPETLRSIVPKTIYRLRRKITAAPVSLGFQNKSTSCANVSKWSKTRNAALQSQRPSIAERSGINHPTPKHRCCRRCDCKCINVQVLKKYRRRYVHATQNSYNSGWIQTCRGSHGGEPSLSKLTSTREAKSWKLREKGVSIWQPYPPSHIALYVDTVVHR